MNLLEHITIDGRVDRQAGVIRGVSILGKHSANNREYSDQAMRDAARLYEGARVRINHPSRREPYRERGLEEEFGVLQNVKVEGNRVRGDLHFVKNHPDADWILERAERFPNTIGLSHNADGKSTNRNGRTVVESLSRVNSVDLVNEPATTGGLFESNRSYQGDIAAVMQGRSYEPATSAPARKSGMKRPSRGSREVIIESVQLELDRKRGIPTTYDDCRAEFLRSIAHC